MQLLTQNKKKLKKAWIDKASLLLPSVMMTKTSAHTKYHKVPNESYEYDLSTRVFVGKVVYIPHLCLLSIFPQKSTALKNALFHKHNYLFWYTFFQKANIQRWIKTFL